MSAVLDHLPDLSAYAQVLTRERTAAEDLVQDTIERALRASKRFQAGTNLHAWLMRIMRNLFTDRCRRSALIRSLNALVVFPEVVSEPQPVSHLDLLSMADVDAALQEIGADHREVFVLAYVDRLSYGTIAQRLRIPLSTVGTRLWRAKAKLRRALRKTSRASFPPAIAANDVGVRRRLRSRRT
jgi:RNA polymerase sigma-70 factor (ECF subfamily)